MNLIQTPDHTPQMRDSEMMTPDPIQTQGQSQMKVRWVKMEGTPKSQIQPDPKGGSQEMRDMTEMKRSGLSLRRFPRRSR